MGGIAPASASDVAQANTIIGITQGAALAGDVVSITFSGELEEPTWAWSLGPVFAGENGALSLDADAIRAISNAHEVAALMHRVHLAIGETPAHFLRDLLSRAGTVKDYVKARDPLAGEREITKVAIRFRYLLEVVDEAFAARGLVQRDKDGNSMIRAERGEATGEETDERGRTVRAGRGYRWGRVAGAAAD